MKHYKISSTLFFTETPGHAGWAETPRTDRGGDAPHETPTPGGKRRSRWDETPAGSQTPMTPRTPAVGGGTPMMTPSGKTPVGQSAMGMVTPSSTGKFSDRKINSEYVHNHSRQIFSKLFLM